MNINLLKRLTLKVIITFFILAISQNVTAQLNITSDGKVGIGVEQPTATLHIDGNLVSDSTIVANTLFASQIVIGGNVINENNIIGSNATFLGNTTLNSCNVLTTFSALSGNFLTDLSANNGTFTNVNAFSGTFDNNVTIGQNLTVSGRIEVDKLFAIDSVSSENGHFENLTSTEVLITEEAIINDVLYVEKGALLRDTTTVEGFLIMENDLEFATPQTYTLNVPALDFDAQGPFNPNPWIKKECYGYLYQAGSDSVVLHASLNLPDECFIKKINVHFFDNSPMHNIDSISVAIKSIPKSGTPIINTHFQSGFNSYDSFLSNEIAKESFDIPNTGTDINNKDRIYYITVDYRLTSNNANEKLRFYGLSLEYDVLKIKGS